MLVEGRIETTRLQEIFDLQVTVGLPGPFGQDGRSPPTRPSSVAITKIGCLAY
jgi:hypothetical protein